MLQCQYRSVFYHKGFFEVLPKRSFERVSQGDKGVFWIPLTHRRNTAAVHFLWTELALSLPEVWLILFDTLSVRLPALNPVDQQIPINKEHHHQQWQSWDRALYPALMGVIFK